MHDIDDRNSFASFRICCMWLVPKIKPYFDGTRIGDYPCRSFYHVLSGEQQFLSHQEAGPGLIAIKADEGDARLELGQDLDQRINVARAIV